MYEPNQRNKASALTTTLRTLILGAEASQMPDGELRCVIMGLLADKQLNTEQAAELLHVSSATLRRWRRDEVGPRWCKLASNVVRYRYSDLQAWIQDPINERG